MTSAGLRLRMGMAALASGSAAGLSATLAFFFGGLLVGSPEAWWGFATLGDWLPIGFFAGLAGASLPALLAGAAMYALAGRFAPARHPLAWAAAGAAVGGALWTLFCLVLGSVAEGGLDPLEIALLAAGLIGGAGGALAFLGTMRLGGPLWCRTLRGRRRTSRARSNA